MAQRRALLGSLLLLVGIPAETADFRIVQKNRTFSARELTIKVGDQVVFVNDDTFNHNVFSETKGLEFDVKQAPGTSQAIRFSQAGSTEVQCAIHPAMKLKLTVAP
jgi:plastocyanin